MSYQAVQHTLNIFQHLYDRLPPLVPEPVRTAMRDKIDAALADGQLTLSELEDIMIFFGKQVWPYMQAFEEMYQLYEEKLAVKLLTQRVSHGVRKKIHLLREMGGTYHDLYKGKAHDIFDHSERNELAALLVDLKHDIRRHAMQAVMAHDKQSYEQKIEKYGKQIEEVNAVLHGLRSYAEEVEHEGLSRDMHDKARTIELSFALLAPKTYHHEILVMVEYYKGKIRELI